MGRRGGRLGGLFKVDTPVHRDVICGKDKHMGCGCGYDMRTEKLIYEGTDEWMDGWMMGLHACMLLLVFFVVAAALYPSMLYLLHAFERDDEGWGRGRGNGERSASR